MKRQFGLDQDIPDDLSSLMRAPTSVHHFLRHTAFDFWKKRFDTITVPGSLREGVCTFPMHGYWHAVMDSFVAELAGSRGVSLIPPEGLHRLTLACCFLLGLFWRMLGNRAGQPLSNGTQKRKGGFGMLATIPLVGRKKLR